MFTTTWARDMKKKLLSMNPKWAGDDNLILKACPCECLVLKRHIFESLRAKPTNVFAVSIGIVPFHTNRGSCW